MGISIYTPKRTLWFFYEFKGHTVSAQEGVIMLMEDYGYSKDKIEQEFKINKTQNPIEIQFGRLRQEGTWDKFFEHSINYLHAFNGGTHENICSVLSLPQDCKDNGQGFVNFILNHFACRH